MSENGDDIIAVMRAEIKKRLHEQWDRHRRLSPHTDHKQIVDITIKQERERLEKIADEYDEKDQWQLAELVREMADGLLDEFAHEFKHR